MAKVIDPNNIASNLEGFTHQLEAPISWSAL